MSTMQRLTLIGMYNYDNTLFDNVNLPDGYDKQTFIDSLLLEHGEKCVQYADVDFMKLALGTVSRKWYNELQRLYEALRAEYNPLWNYDRNEEYDDTTGGTIDNTQPQSSVDESSVSAFNSSAYEPDRRNTSNIGHTNTETHGNIHHEAHLYGNIGVTTTMAMIKEEIELRTKNDLYDIAGRIFANELLIQIY